MKHKILITSLCAVFALPAFAADMPTPPNGERGPRGGGMPMMQNLTEEQQACIEQYGCEMPEMQKPTSGEKPQFGAETTNGEKPQRPEMTDEQKTAMECMQKAMTACGIEMPSKPEMGTPPARPKGEGSVQPRQ